MDTFPVDIEPKQIVRWVREECAAGAPAFKVSARRGTEVREVPVRQEFHLGDQELEDLNEIATVATLEIRPVHAAEGWLLTVTVEDEIGPRAADGDGGAWTERQIDLGTFNAQFIRPERGNATVTAEVEDAAAMARLNLLLDSIETNRHGPARRVKRASTSARQP